MPITPKIAVAVFGLRIAYGAGLVGLPERLTREWIGPAASSPPAQVPVRGLGAREVVLHTGALLAALKGSPLRPWLAASIVGDLVDIGSTAAARGALPEASPRKTLVVAGGSALVSAALGAGVDA